MNKKTTQTQKAVTVFSATFLASLSLMLGCGKSTESSVTLQLGNNQTASLFDLFAPSAQASSVQEVRFCFKRLRFKNVEDLMDDHRSNHNGSTHQRNSSDDSTDDNDEDNIDLNLGEVVYKPSSGIQTLTTVDVPAGDYRRVEFDLDDRCGTGYSIKVDNGAVIASRDHIKIKFSGVFNASQSDTKLTLAVGSIVSALETASPSTNLDNLLEGVSGAF